MKLMPKMPLLFHPQSWGWVFLIALLNMLSCLPFMGRVCLGRWLGNGVAVILPRRKNIVKANIAYCFPELSSQEQMTLCRQHFASLGAGVFEMGLAWRHRSGDAPIAPCVSEGLVHLKHALATGKGILLASGHFAPPDLMGVYISQYVPYHAMVRPQKSRFLNAYAEKKRGYAQSVMYQNQQLKACRLLKRGEHLVYFPDQDYGIKHSVFAPFFGRPAATVLATEKMAKIAGAVILPVFLFRDKQIGGYRLVFMPMITPFPKKDAVASAAAVNAVIEEGIRRFPEQYLWGHRRFKSRPEGEMPLYC